MAPSTRYEGHLRNNLKILLLIVLGCIIPFSMAVINKKPLTTSENIERNVVNMKNDVNNMGDDVFNMKDDVNNMGNNVNNMENNVNNMENNVVNTRSDESTTIVDPTSDDDDDEQNFQNKTSVNEKDRKGRLNKDGVGERLDEEGRSDKDSRRERSNKDGRGERLDKDGRKERLVGERRYLKNNLTDVDFLLDRSETVKREGIYNYHHNPHHVEYQAPDYHYPHHEADHHVNFPYDHQSHGGHYPQPHLHHHSHHHDPGYDVAVKAALGPLVGVALLGVVASLIANPVLLQLGAVGVGRRRRRRHTPHPALELSMITSLLSQVPKSSYLLSQERSMVENYAKCSGLLSSIQDGCVLRLACELWNENSKLFQNQRNVVRRTLTEIMASELIPDHIRNMIYKASQHGKQLGQCEQYHCKKFETTGLEN